MRCKSCGNELEEKSAFCQYCGQRVNDNAGNQADNNNDPQNPFPDFNPFQNNSNRSDSNQGYPYQNQGSSNQGNPFQSNSNQGGYYSNQGSNNNPFRQNPPPPQFEPRLDTTSSIVWSVLVLLFCCMPLGIISLVFSATAGNLSYSEGMDKLKTAKTLNIVGAVVGFFLTIIYIAIFMNYMNSVR